MSEPLRHAPAIVLDCQTTGASPPAGRILELAWTVDDGTATESAIRSRLCSLDGEAVPKRITALTGIDDDQLKDAPTARENILELAEAIRGTGAEPLLAVAHTASFEKRFLNHMASSTLESPLPLKFLCTAALSRRLLPHLPSHSLRAVAGHLGHPTGEIKRARAHVAATMVIWERLKELALERGVHSLEDLFALAASPVPKEKKRFFINDGIIDRLPRAPGIYRFLADDGRVLYVGKATDLKRRVKSYLRPRGYRATGTAEMLSQACDVSHAATGGRLEAALAEVCEIQSLNPPYNTALKREAWDEDPSTFTAAVNALLRGSADSFSDALGLDFPCPPEPEILLHGKKYLAGLLGSDAEITATRLLSLGLCLAAARDDREEADEAESCSEEDDDAKAKEPQWTPERMERRLRSGIAHFARRWLNTRWTLLVENATVMLLDEEGRPVRNVTLVSCSPKGTAPASDQGVHTRARVLTCELRRIAAAGRRLEVMLDETTVMNERRLKPILEILG